MLLETLSINSIIWICWTKRTLYKRHFRAMQTISSCVCIGAGNDLQQNLQKELEAKLSKFRKATFTPSAAADAKLAAAQWCHPVCSWRHSDVSGSYIHNGAF